MLDIIEQELVPPPESFLWPGVPGPDVFTVRAETSIVVEQEYPLDNEAAVFAFFGWAGTLQQLPAGSGTISYQPAPLSWSPPYDLTQAASVGWVRSVVDVVNNSLAGKLNVTLTVTLAAGATTTTVTDARVSAFSAILLMPLTANAAAEQANGTVYVSAQKSGECTLTHANNAQSDRTFRLLIVA